MALPTDICVTLLSCARLVKLLLSAAHFWRESPIRKHRVVTRRWLLSNDNVEHTEFPLDKRADLHIISSVSWPCQVTLRGLPLISQTFPASPPPASCMQWEVTLNKPPWFTQLLEISFKGSALAAEPSIEQAGLSLAGRLNDSGRLLVLQAGCPAVMTLRGFFICISRFN